MQCLIVWAVVISVVVCSSFGQDQEVHCRPRPGCQIARCDPAPASANVFQFLRKNEFPLSCQLPNIGLRDSTAGELRKELDEFKKELRLELDKVKVDQKSALDAMQAKLDRAETTVIKLLESQNAVLEFNCPSPPEVAFGEVKCSDENFAADSVCTVTCLQGRQIKGKDNFVCNKKGEWFGEIPSCSCAACKGGDSCQHSTSWRVTESQITETKSSTLTFGGNSIDCKSETHIHSWSIKWRCRCTDRGTKESVECSKFHGNRGSCENAASALVRRLVERNVYPQPCDAKHLKNGC